MREYSIVFARSARREIEKIHEPLSSRILAKIESLAGTPRPSGCRKIEGADNLWRIRVGDYRVLYAVDDREALVDIIAIRHRSDAYR
jgi:mRNA interferase RelE/StbE